MNLIYILLGLLVLMLALIGLDIYLTRFCRDCGTKMDRHYDPEEDAEVWQCPCCGRSYIIK